MTPTVLLLLSSGWGVRTFLQTDVLPHLLERARLVLLCAPGLVAPLRERLARDVVIESLQPFDPMAGRYGKAYGRRNHHFHRYSSTGTRRIKQERYRKTLAGRWARVLSYNLLELDAWLFADPNAFAEMERREREILLSEYPHAAGYERLLRAHAPDLVVSTLPHAHEEAPPAIVAKHLRLRTAAWVSSWDNLTSKPAYYTAYDHYFVWSETMRGELRRYYPESLGATVDAPGVPHFDWYRRDGMRRSREEHCAAYGLDPARPVVLYGAATPHLAPSEPLIVQRLARDLESLEGRPQLLVRLHPGDSGSRFRDLNVAVQIPGERGEGSLGGYCPTDEENRELVSTVAHADVVVNLASTLTLDAAVCDRPVVNVAYDLSPGKRFQALAEQYYTYEHYRTVSENGAMRLARSPEELAAHVSAYLRDPELDREGRRRLADHWCGPVDGGAGHRLASALLSRLPS